MWGQNRSGLYLVSTTYYECPEDVAEDLGAWLPDLESEDNNPFINGHACVLLLNSSEMGYNFLQRTLSRKISL